MIFDHSFTLICCIHTWYSNDNILFDPDHKPLNPHESSRLRKSLLKIPHSNLHYNYRTENIVNKWPQFCEAECLKILKCKKYRCLQQFIRITLDKTMIKYRHTGTWWLLPWLDYSWGINIDDWLLIIFHIFLENKEKLTWKSL